MRIKWLVVILFCMVSFGWMAQAQQPTITPFFPSTGTRLAQEATLTAQAQASQPTSVVTSDPFELTATVLVANATRTAEASTGRTAVPVNPTNADNFQLTATALVMDVTGTAQSATAQTEVLEEESILPSTFFIFGVLMLIVLAMGAGFVVLTRRGH